MSRYCLTDVTYIDVTSLESGAFAGMFLIITSEEHPLGAIRLMELKEFMLTSTISSAEVQDSILEKLVHAKYISSSIFKNLQNTKICKEGNSSIPGNKFITESFLQVSGIWI